MTDQPHPQFSRRSLELLVLAVVVALVAAVAAWLVNSGTANAAGSSSAAGAAPQGQFAPVQQDDSGSGDGAQRRGDRGDCPERDGSGSGSGAGAGTGSGAQDAPVNGTQL